MSKMSKKESLIHIPRMCPECAYSPLDVIVCSNNNGDAVYDCYCKSCEWSGDILPDKDSGIFLVPPKESDSEDNITQYEKSGYRYFGCEKCGKVVHLDHLREHVCNSLPRTKTEEDNGK